jgi:GR25 family glycosyltransferase involved in LPS biosynthesis
MIDIFEKTYVVNLLSDISKKQFFIEQVKGKVVEDQYEFFEAVDGTNIDINTIDDTIITKYARESVTSKKQKIFGISLTYGALGCALSHKQIWEECQNCSKPFLVFEDDAIFHKQFNTIFPNVCKKLKDLKYDLFYIGYNEIPGFKKKTIDLVLSKPSGLITGTYGYIVSPIGAYKLLNTIFPLNKQVDSSISDNLSKLDVFCSTLKLISPNMSFGSKTQKGQSCVNYIQNDNLDPNIKSDSWYKLFQ